MAKIELGFSCGERWEAMEPLPDGRRCGACGEKVVDLSRLTRKEAARLVARPDAPCVSFEVTDDGETVFRAEPHRAPSFVALGTAGLLLAACAPDGPTACEIVPDPVELAAPTEAADADVAPAVEGADQTRLVPLPGAPTASLARGDRAAAGDANDIDGADARGHWSGSAAPTTSRVHRLAGRRPSITYTRRDRNL